MRTKEPGSHERPDHAGKRARRVVGLYGDPESTWGIGLRASVDALPEPAAARERAEALLGRYPHLGTAIAVEVVDQPAAWERRCAELLSRAYLPGEPLVRIGLQPHLAQIVVAVHHGVCDGLGLAAILGAVLGTPVRASARGIADRTARRGFLAHSVLRGLEAAIRPPPRFALTPPQGAAADPGLGSPDHLVELRLPRQRHGTAHVCAAIAAAYRGRGGRRTPLLVVGASRRSDPTPEPDRSTAYLRLRVPGRAEIAEIARRLRTCHPEPDFPETTLGGAGPRVAHLMRNRLGATALVSNLGVLDGPGLRSVAMYPATSGPRAVGVGLATTSTATCLTLRVRAAEATVEDARALLAELADAFATAGA